MDVAKEGSGATAPWDSSAAADLNRNAEESLKRGGGGLLPACLDIDIEPVDNYKCKPGKDQIGRFMCALSPSFEGGGRCYRLPPVAPDYL